MTMKKNAVELTNVHKKYGLFEALRGVSLLVPEGTIYGLLGPNGAGKSTTIKALVGAVGPTSGSVRILDRNPREDRAYVRRNIGYMPQYPALYEDLTARQNILFFGRLTHTEHLRKKVKAVLAFTELEAWADKHVSTFSGGMKKRVSLACAMVHNPRILFLDEPTAAIDPELKRKIWDMLRQLARTGVTIFVSTHLMDEALLCDQLAILHQGKVIATGEPEHIMHHGKAYLDIVQRGQLFSKTIQNTPYELANALKDFGLASAVSSLNIHHDSLETIILDIIKQGHL